MRDWNASNPDKVKRFAAAKYQRHKEYIKIHVKEYHDANKEKIAARRKVYRDTHKVEIQAKKRADYLANKNKIIARVEIWEDMNKEKVKAIKARSSDKRRKLGSLALNEPFIGANEHHYDKLHTIWIPQKLHESVRHNVWNGRNMSEINNRAFAWYTEDWT